jgi:hypothetical protein
VIRLHFCLVIGRTRTGVKWRGAPEVGTWKFENWHLYRLVPRVAARDPKITWTGWERISMKIIINLIAEWVTTHPVQYFAIGGVIMLLVLWVL